MKEKVSHGKPRSRGVVYNFIPLSYDRIPNKSYRSASHTGYQLTLGLDLSIANLGLNANIELGTSSDEVGNMTFENPDRYRAGYLDRLRSIREYFTTNATFPVPNGYSQRDLCTVKSECIVGFDCIKLCLLCPPKCDLPNAKNSTED
jgi:hypothetical protein